MKTIRLPNPTLIKIKSIMYTYAVKVVNILFADNSEAVTKERLWQIEC